MCHIYCCIVEKFRRRKFHDYAWGQTFHSIYCAIFVCDICIFVLIFCIFGWRMDGVHLHCCIHTALSGAVGILTCDLSTLQSASPLKVLPLRYFSGWRPLLGVYFTIVRLTPMYSCSSNFDLPFRQDFGALCRTRRTSCLELPPFALWSDTRGEQWLTVPEKVLLDYKSLDWSEKHNNNAVIASKHCCNGSTHNRAPFTAGQCNPVGEDGIGKLHFSCSYEYDHDFLK